MSNSIVCPFALGGINYKNGFVTSCPQQSDQLHLMKKDEDEEAEKKSSMEDEEAEDGVDIDLL